MQTDIYTSAHGASVTRFADVEILRYEVPGFETLPLERKLFEIGRAHV